MNNPPVLIITLNWRQPETTLECVQSLQALSYSNFDILVIDNGSADTSVTILETQLPDSVHLMALPQNLGFAAGCNIGLKKALAENYAYALLINNDAFPEPDMLGLLVTAAQPDIGLLSPKILYEAEPSRIWFGGGKQHKRLLEMRARQQGVLDGEEWTRNREVDYLVGTCLLVNLTAVNHIGLLDENYFMYYEDLDWSIRWRRAGYRLLLVGNARLYHRVAVSSGGEDSPSRRYNLARSSVYFFRQHASFGSPLSIFLFRSGSALKTFFRLLVHRKWETAVSYLRGLRDGWQLSSPPKT